MVVEVITGVHRASIRPAERVSSRPCIDLRLFSRPTHLRGIVGCGLQPGNPKTRSTVSWFCLFGWRRALLKKWHFKHGRKISKDIEYLRNFSFVCNTCRGRRAHKLVGTNELAVLADLSAGRERQWVRQAPKQQTVLKNDFYNANIMSVHT